MKLYHQTKVENIESIMKIGLIPNELGIIYLSSRNDLNFGDITLEVETGDNRLTAFDDCREWEVLCWGGIKPSNIKILTDRELVPNIRRSDEKMQ